MQENLQTEVVEIEVTEEIVDQFDVLSMSEYSLPDY
jgi:hypothetical protein